MPTTRSYADACGIARALDVVGERWALLLVRELLLGPQRFVDLRRGLSGASSNLVADRLREMRSRGVVDRRRLPPPAASDVYELTEWGRELEPTALTTTSMLIYLRASIDPGDRTYRVELDDRVWTVRAQDGVVLVEPGAP